MLSAFDLQDAPPLKFAMFFAGALIRDRNLAFIYKEKVTLPSLHIIGDRDYVKEVRLRLQFWWFSSITPQLAATPAFFCLRQ